jgi:putative exosortase-associated protein (TIGR04073 family)
MMKSGGVKFTAMLMVAAFMCHAALAAQPMTYDPLNEIPEPTKTEQVLTKLGRGLSNIMFGWAEIPVTFDEKLKAGKSLQYLVGVVPVLGTARAFIRTGVGVFDVITFPVKRPYGVNYGSVLEPEYLF